MRKSYLIGMLGLFIGLGATAQSFKLIDPYTSQDVTGGTIEAVGSETDNEIAQGVYAINLTGSSVTLQVKRILFSTTTDTRHTTCFGPLCPPPVLVQSMPTIEIVNAGGTPLEETVVAGDTSKTFSAKHFPDNNVGCEFMRFVFYDKNNPNDSTWVDIEFEHGASNCFVGLEEAEASVEPSLEVYPNPASTDATLEYVAPKGSKVQLKVFNILGKEVRNLKASASEGKTKVALNDLPRGLYLCSLEVDGKTMRTEKLMVR